ncbi:MAG: hypothetical protein SW833_24470 [Cyanobacteriota bacterium]|nr:hypothetical protein [Cyanobacteriota bacterium]
MRLFLPTYLPQHLHSPSSAIAVQRARSRQRRRAKSLVLPLRGLNWHTGVTPIALKLISTRCLTPMS